MSRLTALLAALYGSRTVNTLLRGATPVRVADPVVAPSGIEAGGALLVAYPDHVGRRDGTALSGLARRLDELVGDTFSHVHVLPPFVSSGDGGFSVVDHGTIDPELGSWADLTAIGERRGLVLDLVLNHVSSAHPWVSRALAGEPEYEALFIDVPEDADFTSVARSRHHPPTTWFATARGSRRLWTRYGPDQVDLDYSNPDTLARMLTIAESYLDRGVDGLRLDAVAFAWKRLGTTCSNLPETRILVRIFKEFVSERRPSALLIAETDVAARRKPVVDDEGGGADFAYRYEGAPIVLHAVLTGRTERLESWCASLENGPAAAFNFIGTHDGIHLRPKDPPLDSASLQVLCDRTTAAGGTVIIRDIAGRRRPYELDVAAADLLDTGDGQWHKRLVAALSIVAMLPGAPLVFLGTLLGLRNDAARAAATGDPREIVRRRLHPREFDAHIARPEIAFLIDRTLRMVYARRTCDAFEPAAPMHVIPSGPGMVVLERRGRAGWARLYVALRGGGDDVVLPRGARDPSSGRTMPASVRLEPFQPLLVTGEHE